MSIDRQALTIATGFCMAFCFTFYILGTNLHPWMRLEPTSAFKETTKFVGLWKVCKITLDKSIICVQRPATCEFIHDKKKKKSCRRMLTGRILMVTACVLAGLTALSNCICGLKGVNQYRILFILCKIPLFITLTIGIIALYLGIYSGSRKDQLDLAAKLDYGAIYFIIAVDMNIFTGIITLFIH